MMLMVRGKRRWWYITIGDGIVLSKDGIVLPDGLLTLAHYACRSEQLRRRSGGTVSASSASSLEGEYLAERLEKVPNFHLTLEYRP